MNLQNTSRGGSEDMAERDLEETRTGPNTPGWLMPVLGIMGVLIAGSAWYQHTGLESMRRESAEREMARQKEVESLRAIIAKADGQLEVGLSELRNEVSRTREETTAGVKKAQVVAVRRADAIVGQMEQKQNEKQLQQEKQFNEELAKVRESHENTSNRVASISSEVGAVKTEVASTKTHLEGAITELQRVRGDMGLVSGLIATNSKEIQYLKELGERNIHEFTLAKTGKMQEVGDIRVLLKKVDPKRNRYTLEVLAGDKLVEKKDRTLNEPVQFFVPGKSRQAYELVVNEVKKHTIVGYLSAPKMALAQANRAVSGSK